MSSSSEEVSVTTQIQVLDNAIANLATTATGPLEVESDAGRVKMHNPLDLIKAANYLAGIAAAQSPGRGLRFTRLIPDGTVQGPRRSFRSSWRGWPGGWNGYSWP